MSASLAAVMSYGKVGSMGWKKLLPYTYTHNGRNRLQTKKGCWSYLVITGRRLPSQCINAKLQFGNSNIYLPSFCKSQVWWSKFLPHFQPFSGYLSRTRRSTARQAVVFSSQRRFSWPKGSRCRINSFEAFQAPLTNLDT